MGVGGITAFLDNREIILIRIFPAAIAAKSAVDQSDERKNSFVPYECKWVWRKKFYKYLIALQILLILVDSLFSATGARIRPAGAERLRSAYCVTESGMSVQA